MLNRSELEVILVQLIGLERTLNNSIDHTQEINRTYPTVVKKYNQILSKLKELAKKDSTLDSVVNILDKFEEKDFLPSGNYKYAVELQTTIRIIISDLKGLGLTEGAKTTESATVPIVFISYATEEIALAYFIEKVLQRWTNNKIEVFIAKRDLKSSEAWVKIMEEKLKTAYCIIPICSNIAKNNPWVWWESAAVWGANHKVHPLFTNISPEEFGPPLTLFVQGKSYFNKDEFIATLLTVCQQLKINAESKELDEEELAKFDKLHQEYTKFDAPKDTKAKYVDLEYPKDKGLIKIYEELGYQVRWFPDGSVHRRIDIEGWEYAYDNEKDGTRVVLKMKDRPEDQALLKKKFPEFDIISLEERRRMGCRVGGGRNGYFDISYPLICDIINKSDRPISLVRVRVKNDILGEGKVVHINDRLSRLPVNIQAYNTVNINLHVVFPNEVSLDKKDTDFKLQIEFDFGQWITRREVVAFIQ